jgi:large subunit ribosomal protein L37Ae
VVDIMRTPHFGAKLRKKFQAAKESKKKRYECPKCHKIKVRNAGHCRWDCNSCGAQFAGGAYAFRTEIGEIVSRFMEEAAKNG